MSDYIGPERRSESDHGATEVLNKIAELRAYVDNSFARFVTVEYLDQRIQRLGLDVVATVSSQLRAMMKDAMSSAIKEEMDDVQTQFKRMQIEYSNLTTNALTEERIIEIMQSQQEQARKERREDFQRLFNYIKVGVPTVVGFLTAFNLIGGWLGWWG